MKNHLILAIVILSCKQPLAQESALPVPYFSAVIVSNVDSSKHWYTALFDLKVKNEMHDSKSGYDIVILQNENLLLELLQLKESLSRKELLKTSPANTPLQGHFKFGFKVNAMNTFLKKLESLNIVVPQIWTDLDTKKRNFLISDPDGNLLQFFE